MLLPFELDPQIIHHIIYSQAGSIGKAIIELLMNSVDAAATKVRLSMTADGFTCSDDGNGFQSREDVLRYFGRFGTPHQDGDATYGRFRLGRGQIMAHASTSWCSSGWMMRVDTRTMGYNYDLSDLEVHVKGCVIQGTWYEPLSDAELMSAIQEVRDLVRYTPITVELNERVITRDPRSEKWDFEDEFAYYRAKAEGAVSIYNQGVLVRHDPAHQWGAGGLIVSKQAIGLNVSRTEILRSSCQVWKPIAKQFARLADAVSARLGDHRKTEARREKSARALLSGDPKICEIFVKEEVVTVLPGKRHISLEDFLRKANIRHKGKITIIENGFDVPKGEAIAREGISQVVHPQTLQRFGCFSPEEFRECLDRIAHNIRNASANEHTRLWGMSWLEVPEIIDFATLREAFVERTRVVSEKEVLDTETRRAWTALRWCIQQYAGACAGGRVISTGRLASNEHRMHIMLGDSNTAAAWTDGKTYIAIDLKIVRQLRSEPLKTAAYVFSLVEHEVAHQGDSLDCGHDEAFYQRYHDISIQMSAERQRYMHMWLMKYTTSMEREGKKARSKAWSERYLVDRVGSGRQKLGLPRAIEDVSAHPVVATPVPEENMSLITVTNFKLVASGQCPPPPDWEAVVEKARIVQSEMAVEQRKRAAARADEQAEEDAIERMFTEQARQELEAFRARCAEIVGVPVSAIEEDALNYLYQTTDSDESVIAAWAERAWEGWFEPDDLDLGAPEDFDAEAEEQIAAMEDPRSRLDASLRDLVHEGETWWGLERNAAAAGFVRVEAYLKWRATP